ncbi:RNA polymerase sigma factor [Poritiphilus flavus]|uniref:RNA polymerase sigma factor n=1 Tax=Poritiphilus flavus TaxID=2697053 RepID=A0A6L9EBN1_9FLAO|nr:sigma-70 family RNA polymerase sigma factor [Poritiphilus flavus]NAS12146.1 sigma-70 family RNA polymerase sigma factor [Poritiphilus flavus]
MSFENEEEYIDRAKAGDLMAFSHLVEKYKEMVYAVTLKILGNTFDAEDIAQESFIKAYQSIADFNKRSKFSTWLYTITYRSALYYLRKNRIPTRTIDVRDKEELLATTNTQVEDLKLGEQQEFIKKAIAALPPIEGLLITLFYIDENSIEEISSITNLSKTNIKVKLFRARKKLRKALSVLLKGESNSIL